MTKGERRSSEDRRDWLKRVTKVNNIIRYLEALNDKSAITLESVSDTLNICPTILSRIFSEIKDDYAHRFQWLEEID